MASAATAAAPAGAGAQAWVQPAGHQQAITTLAPRGGTGEPELEVYLERGLGRGWSVVASPSVEAPRPGADGYQRLTALRHGGPLAGGWAAAAQLGVVETVWWDPRLPRARSSDAYLTLEPRLAVGRSLPDGGWLEAAIGVRGCPGLTGWHAPPRWQVAGGRHQAGGTQWLAKAWGGGGVCGEPDLTVQASQVHPLTDRIGVEAGWRVAGPVEAPPGLAGASRSQTASGPVIGLWVRY